MNNNNNNNENNSDDDDDNTIKTNLRIIRARAVCADFANSLQVAAATARETTQQLFCKRTRMAAAAVAGTAGDAKAICELKKQLTRVRVGYTSV